MILYFDTSALVKAYVTEAFSNEIFKEIEQAKIIASNPIAYVEAHAAFSRVRRENKITEQEFDVIKKNFRNDWQNYLLFQNTPVLLNHAADLAEMLSLRAYDSIHLASADLLAKQSKQPVKFACFDLHLNKAANVLGLSLLKIAVPI